MSVFIISEIGINHNGNIDTAKKMIKLSKEIGVDAVKFQKRDINLVYSQEQLGKFRESPWGTTEKEQKEGLEFDQKEYEIIDDYCKELKLEWLASAWDKESINFLNQFNLRTQKVPSALIVDEDYLKKIAKNKKYTFISTGMCEMEHIEKCVEIFKSYSCPFELMHCISAYPFDDNKANLKMINILREKFKCKVGYSGHEKGGQAISFAAVSLGASSIERHFTLDRTMYGSDQSASLEPEGFKSLVNGIRKISNALKGNGVKKILPEEVEVAKKLRSNLKL
jgi:N-acetylneuraminate synthase